MAVEKGDKVKLEYEGKLDSGEVFDTSSQGGQSHPLEFIVGQGTVISGLDEAIEGMEEGEEKEFTVTPEQSYGEHNSELKKQFPRDQVPLQQDPQVGQVLAVNTPDGRQFPVKIDSFDENNITLDLNHPLAGQNLHFKVKVVGIEKNAAEKQQSQEGSEQASGEETSGESQDSGEESSSESESSEDSNSEEEAKAQ
ncbi:MAG: peptidylprolyl isomerase [Candidatus Pacearchaeota archaeon]